MSFVGPTNVVAKCEEVFLMNKPTCYTGKSSNILAILLDR